MHTYFHTGSLSYRDCLIGILSYRVFVLQGVCLTGIVLQGFCLIGILSYRDFVIQGFCLIGILSYRVFVTQGVCHTGILSYRDFVIQGFCLIGRLWFGFMYCGMSLVGLDDLCCTGILYNINRSITFIVQRLVYSCVYVNTYISRNEWDINIWVIQGFCVRCECLWLATILYDYHHVLQDYFRNTLFRDLCSDGGNGGGVVSIYGYNCHTGLFGVYFFYGIRCSEIRVVVVHTYQEMSGISIYESYGGFLYDTRIPEKNTIKPFCWIRHSEICVVMIWYP